MFIITWKCTSS